MNWLRSQQSLLRVTQENRVEPGELHDFAERFADLHELEASSSCVSLRAQLQHYAQAVRVDERYTGEIEYYGTRLW